MLWPLWWYTGVTGRSRCGGSASRLAFPSPRLLHGTSIVPLVNHPLPLPRFFRLRQAFVTLFFRGTAQREGQCLTDPFPVQGGGHYTVGGLSQDTICLHISLPTPVLLFCIPQPPNRSVCSFVFLRSTSSRPLGHHTPSLPQHPSYPPLAGTFSWTRSSSAPRLT